jgi:hypothetical protein
MVREPVSYYLLGFTSGIHICSVNEITAGFSEFIQYPVTFLLISLPSESHCAKAEITYQSAGFPEFFQIHIFVFP